MLKDELLGMAMALFGLLLLPFLYITACLFDLLECWPC